MQAHWHDADEPLLPYETARPIFVYGTLLPGQPNAHLWGDSVTLWQPAGLDQAALHDVGHYPMLVPAKDGTVLGMLAHIAAAQFAAVIADLDNLERFNPTSPATSYYRRCLCQVTTDATTSIAAWVYVGQTRLANRLPRIDSGDWLAHTAANADALAMWWQTHRTNYAAKLFTGDSDPIE